MQGIWGGMIGGLIAQTLILIWVTLRTDWNKEVLQSFHNLMHLLFKGHAWNIFFTPLYSEYKSFDTLATYIAGFSMKL